MHPPRMYGHIILAIIFALFWGTLNPDPAYAFGGTAIATVLLLGDRAWKRRQWREAWERRQTVVLKDDRRR